MSTIINRKESSEVINGRQIIYDMPSDEYHKLERLSSSGIKKILVSPQDFWYHSWMNKNRKEKKSDAFNLGTAYHTRILEGDNVYRRRYAIKPNVDKRTTEGKLIYSQWKSMYGGAEEIEEDIFHHINDVAKYIEDIFDCFKDGKSEVTVLWNDEETNVPMKARIDYLKNDKIEDLKTFSNSTGSNIDYLLSKHIVNYDYHIQHAVYTEALPDREFDFVFVQSDGPINIDIKPFSSNLLIANKAKMKMREGINKFRDMYLKYGTNKWFDEREVKPFTDEDFPMYVYER